MTPRELPPRRKRKRRTVMPQGMTAQEPSINITPLIDVVLVLLIVFMVLTPRPQHELDVHLSAAEHTERQTDVDPEQVVVSLRANSLQVNDAEVDRSALEEHLRRLFADKPQADRVVFVLTADDVSYEAFVSAVDAAKLSGAQTVGFATDALP